VLVTANHPNALLDPLLIFDRRTAARPLAKAPLFEQVFVGSMLRALGGLPIYRRQDDPAQMHRNDETFRRAIDALEQGDAVQIFPEGRSHSEPALVELRTGAARIALGAEAQSSWRLGLRIVPVGITYRRKALFRGHALVQIGPPFTIEDLRTEFERDEQAGVCALTDRIAANLQAVTLNLAQREDQQLNETAEALYVREKGLARFREREGLSVRMPRLQRFAEGLAWLRANDPDRHERLRREVALPADCRHTGRRRRRCTESFCVRPDDLVRAPLGRPAPARGAACRPRRAALAHPVLPSASRGSLR
jgi:1-acyl-sn-glycerol-3-phosphate acyltransferase